MPSARVRSRLALVVPFGLAGLALFAGCFPSVSVPQDAQILCSSTADCPADLVCDTGAKLCVPKGATLDRAPPFLVDSSVDKAVIGPTQTALVAFTASEALGVTPKVVYARAGVDVDVPVDGSDTAFVAHVTPGDGDASGPVTLTATLVDEAKNQTTARIPVSLAFDLDPPAPVAVTTTISADPATNPLFPAAPRAIRTDSGLVVDVIFAEPVASAALSLTNAGGPLDGALSSAVGTIDGERAEFTFAAGAFASVADGALGLSLTATDAHGNTFTGDVAALLASPLVVDDTPPDAPSFTSFARAPWGTVQGTAPTTGSGTAPDALLVLLLPEGVNVVDGAVPPTVDRVVPAADGAFSFALPIDVPGVTVVAVDAAGNMSAPASAALTAVTASVIDPTSPHQITARPVALAALVQGADRPASAQVRAGGDTVTAAPYWRPVTTAVDGVIGGAALAFDPATNEVIAVSNDGRTSFVDGGQVKDSGQPPLPVRGGQAMAFDARRGVVVLFGGHGPDGLSTNQLFEWDGTHWTQRLANDPGDASRPAPRVAHSMAFVPSLGGVVVVDGCGQEVVEGLIGCNPGYSDVWLWDGAQFTALCQGAACTPLPFNLRPSIGVDQDGRLVDGGGDTEPFHVGFPAGAPVMAAFDPVLHHWVSECGDACADDVPVDAAAVQLDGGLAFLGGCPPASGLSGTCLSKYDASGFTPVALVDRGPAHGTPNPFQTQPVIGLPDGTILEVGATTTVRTKDGARDRVRPSGLTPRCAAAATQAAGDVIVSGGCGQCPLSPGGIALQCTAPAATTEVIAGDVVLAAPDGPAGSTFAAVVGGVPVVVSTVAGADPGETGVASSLWDGSAFVPADTLFDAGVTDLRAVGLVVDPDDTARALVFFASGEATLDRIGAVDATGALSTLCASNCSVGLSLGFAGAGGDGGSALFGGWIDGRQLSGQTSVVAAGALAPVTVAGPSPAPRGLAALAFDDERKVSFMFGGTADFSFRNSLDNPLCGSEPTPDCHDAWAFDSTTSTWTPLLQVPVLPFGDPGTRVASAAVVTDGALVVTGGSGGLGGGGDGEAWRLEVSPALAPAHLFAADLSAEGADAAGAPTAVDVTWCGTATDAGGNAAPVDVELWTPTGFAAMASTPVTLNAASCVAATTVDGTPLDFAPRGPQRVLTARVKAHVGTATGAGFAALTTTAFEVTARFAR